MSIWTSILGTGDTLNKGMDLIDNAFYTDEERAEEKRKLLDSMRPFKLAQRVLAKQVFNMFAFVLVIEVTLAVLGAKWPICWETVALINTLEVVLVVGWLTLAVGTLYFTGGVAAPFMNRKAA